MKHFMQALLSLIVVLVALYIIVSNNHATETVNWAFGVVGLVLGYWFDGPKVIQ